MAAEHGDETHGHGPARLAHHFDTLEQQFEAGKQGMWLFLATEILLFSGLFCAYAVYRANHPEIFVWAHQFLDSRLGGINTVVLICSSLTMALGVRCAQTNAKNGLIACLILTLLCACGFLGIKYVEYTSKWKHGLRFGKYYNPDEDYIREHGKGHGGDAGQVSGSVAAKAPGGGAASVAPGSNSVERNTLGNPTAGTPLGQVTEKKEGRGAGKAPDAAAGKSPIPPAFDDKTSFPPPGESPAGLASALPGAHAPVADRPRNVRVFFSIYFGMTGLHALHVLAGMCAILWVLRRAMKGEFSSAYNAPVDFVGLYWHLVDVIWIFLFPLLYLIH